MGRYAVRRSWRALSSALSSRSPPPPPPAAAAKGGAADGLSPLSLPAEVTELCAHLVEISPSLFAELAPCLPTAISGRDFLARYGSHGDDATSVDGPPPTTCAAARRTRCTSTRGSACSGCCCSRQRRRAGDGTAAADEALLVALGELMYQSHASYSAIGLGSAATDEIVRLVRAAGPASGLYGAKITGGGSGGTVCVLGAKTAAAEASFARVVAAYHASSGHAPHVFRGSSAGAVAFGHVVCDVRKGSAQLGAARGGAAAGRKRQHD